MTKKFVYSGDAMLLSKEIASSISVPGFEAGPDHITLASNDCMVDLLEIAEICQNSLGVGSTAVVKPFRGNFIIEGASAELAGKLLQEGFDAQQFGDVVLAASRSLKKKAKKSKVTATPIPSSRMAHLAAPHHHRVASALWKKAVEAQDFGEFNDFCRELDGLIESYRTRCGHEPSESYAAYAKRNRDYRPGGETLANVAAVVDVIIEDNPVDVIDPATITEAEVVGDLVEVNDLPKEGIEINPQ